MIKMPGHLQIRSYYSPDYEECRDLFSRDAATYQHYHLSHFFKTVLVHYHGNHFCCHGLFQVVYLAFGSMFVPLSYFMGSFVCRHLPSNMEDHQLLLKNRLVGH